MQQELPKAPDRASPSVSAHRSHGLDIRPAEERLVAAVPMHRMATPEEVGDLVLFLLSDQSRYITGAEIAIDGGASL
ncbi:MAG: SDR family oxidoreductase [Janthinobacterium lividum]